MTIVNCPRCRDEVTVPAKASPRALVRCPLCLEEYLLSEALAEMPPTLLVVGGEIEKEEALVGAGVAEAEVGGEYRMAGGGFGGALDSSAPAGAAVTTARPGVKSGARGKRKEKSALGEMLKIVMGGVIGLSLGLLVLWWGLHKDPLKLGPKVSPWLPIIVPAEFHHKPTEPTTAQTGTSGSQNSTATQLNVPAAGPGGAFQAHSNSQLAANSSKPSTKPAGGLQTLPDVLGGETASSEPVVPASIDLPSFDPLPTTPESNPGETLPVEPPSGAKPAEVMPPDNVASPPSEAPSVDLTDLLPDGNSPPATTSKPTPPAPATEDSNDQTPGATAADLANAATAATEALAKVEESKGETKEVRQQLFTDLYLAVAEGGRTLSHLDPADADVAEPLAGFKQLLGGLAEQAGKLSAFGHLGRTHLPQRKAGEGYAFSGKVIEYKVAGSVFESTLDAGNGVTVQLVTKFNPQDLFQIGDQLLVAGRIVDEPQKNIAGYEGEAERVVLLGDVALVPKAE